MRYLHESRVKPGNEPGVGQACDTDLDLARIN